MNKPTNAKQNHQYIAQNHTPTQFEIYLGYSTEKEVSVKRLSEIFDSLELSEKDILDVGCGDGSYLIDTIANTQSDIQPNITFVEPSKALFKKLLNNTSDIQYNVNCINQKFENFLLNNTKEYDLILASHLYHFSRSEYSSIINDMISLLKPSGTLIWVERAPDDIANFKKKFKTMLIPSQYPTGWKPRDYKYAYEILKKLSESSNHSLQLFKNESTLKFPSKDNLNDTIAIIEFYLNIEWSSLSETDKEEILNYIREKKGTFTQREAIIVYTKNLDI